MMVTCNLPSDTISVKAEINNPSKEAQKGNISYEVVNWKDGKVNTTGTLGGVTVAAGTNWIQLDSIKLDKPIYWDNETPHLYLLRLLDENGASIGVQRFGYRDFRAKGEWLYLNGKKFKPRGFTLDMWREERLLNNIDNTTYKLMELYKELGINIIRPHSRPGVLPETFVNICDELGITIYLDWSGPNYYKSFGKKWKDSILEMWPSFEKYIKDSYSHPSIVMWSFGNEIYENHHGLTFSKNLDTLYGYVKELDKQGRPICTSSGRQTWEAISGNVLKERTDILDDHQYRGAYSGSWQDNIEHIERYAEIALKRYGKPMPKIDCEYGCPGDNLRYRPITFDKLYPAFELNPSDPEFKKQYISFLQSSQAEVGTYIRLKMNYCSPKVYIQNEAECRRLYAQKRFKRFVEIYRRAGEKCIGGHTNTQYYDLVNLSKNWRNTATTYGKPGPMAPNNDKALVMPLTFEVKRLYNPTLVTAGVFNQHPIGGSTQNVEIYVTNDLNEANNFKVVAQLNLNDEEVITLKELDFGVIGEMGQKKITLSYQVPEFASTKRGKLELYLFKDGERVGDNYYPISIPNNKLNVASDAKVALYDNYGRLFRGMDNTITTTEVLKNFKYDFEPIADFKSLDSYKYLIIGANSFDKDLIASSDVIFKWIKNGGKLLCFEQSLCGKIPFYPNNSIVAGSPSTYVSLTVYDHPLFKGLEQEDFDTWANDRGTLFDYAIGPLNEGLVAVSPTGSWMDTDEIKAIVSDVKLGKGEIIFSQLSATKRYNLDAVAKSYLKNALNYFSKPEVSGFAAELPEQEFSKVTYLDDKDAHYIDISKVVNQGFKDEQSGDQKGGWSDFGDSNDFKEIPVGTSRLQGAVPFKIIDPAKNNGKSCLVLKGKVRKYFPKKVTGIPVDAVLNNIYVLHTSMYTDDGPAVKYILHYEDGQTKEFIATGKREIPDWWHPKDHSNAIVVFQKKSKGLYLSDFVNPLPKVKIKSMDIESYGKAIPIVVAITGRKRFTSVISGVGEK
jgi:beta-galactosidase